MSNAMIANPAASVSAMNRPVTVKDVANKLGKSYASVQWYLTNKQSANLQTPTAILVRKTAEEMGFRHISIKPWMDSVSTEVRQTRCEKCGKLFIPNRGDQKYCKECRVVMNRTYRLNWYYRNRKNWYGGNFKTREEEIARMQELRAQGYSNAEIAKAIGRSYDTVRDNLGKQDPELTKQNVAMAAHIRAQKNAARKQYILNKPIREYNAKVEAHNKMKAEIAKMEAELRPQTPSIERAAQIRIDFPLVNLSTVQPTALQ